MKKLCVGVLLGLALLFAQTVSAAPCTICSPYDTCDRMCEHCYPGLGGPGWWYADETCWGDMVVGSCGDYGPCSGQPASNWHSAPFMDQDVNPDEGLSLCPL